MPDAVTVPTAQKPLLARQIPQGEKMTVTQTARKLGLTLLLLLTGVAGIAFAQEVPAWPPHDAPVAMPQGQPAAAPPESLIEAGELLTGRGQELHNTRILVKDGKIVAVGPNLTAP